jgi:hypothetical protein
MRENYRIPMAYEARLTQLSTSPDGFEGEWQVQIYEIDPGGSERKAGLDICESLDEARRSAVKMLADIRGYSEVIR